MSANKPFEVFGTNTNALFSLKAYRGEGMILLAMNWKQEKPPLDFVGFSIEYKEPGGFKFFALKNRISFADANGKVSKEGVSSLLAPIQKFRWIHFPRNAEMKGDFIYLVKPVFMNNHDELSYGEPQEVSLQLHQETYPDILNVTFTRGFISSQAFVDKYEKDGGIKKLLPSKADTGLDFIPTHPNSAEALTWMGFEARSEIFKLLDKAIDDKKAEVKVIAYDLNVPEIVDKLAELGPRLKIIIDNSGDHEDIKSAESKAAQILSDSTNGQVKRQHMGQLQHNKTIIVDGPKIKSVICGSTNFTWRGLYVQANNAIVLKRASAVKSFKEAFENYWQFDKVKDFGKSGSAVWSELHLDGINAKISFSPHISDNALLDEIADDITKNTQSNLFYSLAFLYQTTGSIKKAIATVTDNDNIFVYGIADKKVKGLDLQKPNGNKVTVYPAEISKNLPEPFKSEPTGGVGTRMHHKFIVIDFNKPTARVYLGSYNFPPTADLKNGENLIKIDDRRIVVSYMLEALRIFDHYHFRVAQKESAKARVKLMLAKPPRVEGEKPWWDEYYTERNKILDREMFAEE